MSKNNIILLVVIVVLVSGLGVGTYLVLKPKQITNPRASSNDTGFLNTAKKSQVQNLIYEDTAGFSFDYPSDFVVTDKSLEDDSYYSYLDIKNEKGSIFLIVSDTKYKTLDDWKKANTTATIVGATTLGGVKANQYNLAGNLVTVAIEEGILYELRSVSQDAKIDAGHTTILDSFKFANANNTAAGDGTIYEEEEVIE